MSPTTPTIVWVQSNASVKLPNIKALFFDLDQTLLDGSQFGMTISETCDAIAERVPGLEANQLLEANLTVFATLGPQTMNDWTLGRLTGRELALEAWRRTLLECNHSNEAVTQFAAETHLRLTRSSYQLFDDARQLIDVIDCRPIPVALITNGASDTQREKLEATGILDWFDVLVISGEHGVAKPDKAAFDLAIEQLGVEHNAVWHVGDSLENDVVGAQAAGLTGVWLNRTGATTPHSVTPDLEIVSLTALIDLIASR